MASLVDILRERGYENHIDYDLRPVFNDLGNRVYDETYASGDDCQWHRNDIRTRLRMGDDVAFTATDCPPRHRF
jgi:hypothetical protein